MFNFEATKEQITIAEFDRYFCTYFLNGRTITLNYTHDLTGLCELLDAQGWITDWDINDELEYVINEGEKMTLLAEYMADFNQREWHLLVAILENERTWKAAAREAVAALKIANPHQ